MNDEYQGADNEEEDREYTSMISKVMDEFEAEGVLDPVKSKILNELGSDKINKWYDSLKGFGPKHRVEVLSGRKEKPTWIKEIYDYVEKLSTDLKSEYPDEGDVSIYDLGFHLSLAICGIRASQKEVVNSENFNHVKYHIVKNIEEYEYPYLRTDLEKVLNEYTTVKSEDYSNHPLADHIRNQIPVTLRKIVNDFDKEEDTKVIKGSAGISRWANVPWVSVMDERETKSVKEGMFIVYLFSEDMERLYLTLMNGVTEFKEEFTTSEARRKLQEKANELQTILDIPDNFKKDKNIDLADSGIGKDYEFGIIAYKEYPRGGVPDNSTLVKDLVALSDVYNDFLDSRPDVDVEDIKPKPENFVEMNFIDYLEGKGYFYKREIIENFLLSLKVKPFLILTGNTGTGKTKLAQLFGQYLMLKDNNRTEEIDTSGGIVTTDVLVGKSHSSGGWSFPRKDFFKLFPKLKEIEGTYDIEIDGMPNKGRLQLNTRLFYKDRDGKISERLRELAKENPRQRIDLTIMIDQPKERQIESFTCTDRRYEVIPVGSDWTDNKNIVGFYNVITGEYQKTTALDLIMYAINNKNGPYLLILDEMNLSHVERYFSDFLSAIESNESIPLHNQNEELNVPSEIDIPENLLIVGTVNVDETTYMFSPKVLDRANTIEVLPTPAEEYMNLENEIENFEGDVEYIENPLSNINLRNKSIEELRRKMSNVKISSGESFWNVYSTEINKFQTTLKEANFDFAFRVIDEITRFMFVAWIYEGRPAVWNNWRRYLDAQIKQKILPKLHGSQRELGTVLEDLLELFYQGDVYKPIHRIKNIDTDENVFYRSSAMKVVEMSRILYNQRYVSFTK